jgi:hypothetical protein
MDNRKLELMLELERRGDLPPDKALILNELRARGAVPEVAADSGFPGPGDDVRPGMAGAGSDAAFPDGAGLAALAALSNASNQEPGIQAAPPGRQGEAEELPGLLDFLGAHFSVAPTDELMAAPDMIAMLMGGGGTVSDPEFRDTRQSLVEGGAMAAATPAAMLAGKAGLGGAGRIAREFLPDIAGGIAGGAAGTSVGGPVGGLAGARVGHRLAANAFGRGRGIVARTAKAVKGAAKLGSKPVAKAAVSGKAGSNAARHARLVRKLLGGK